MGQAGTTASIGSALDQCLTVEETDGSPSMQACEKLLVSNGSLTDNANGTFTFSGGGGSGDITDVGDCATGSCWNAGTLTAAGNLTLSKTTPVLTFTDSAGGDSFEVNLSKGLLSIADTTTNTQFLQFSAANQALYHPRLTNCAATGFLTTTSDGEEVCGAGKFRRIVVVPDATSITPNSDVADVVHQTNTQASGTLTFNAPTGSPSDGQALVLRIVSTNTQTNAWNAAYSGNLPGSTGVGTTYYAFIYYTTGAVWHYTGGAAI